MRLHAHEVPMRAVSLPIVRVPLPCHVPTMQSMSVTGRGSGSGEAAAGTARHARTAKELVNRAIVFMVVLSSIPWRDDRWNAVPRSGNRAAPRALEQELAGGLGAAYGRVTTACRSRSSPS